MIKLKSILKENHILITEKFAAGKLRALTNHWQGLETQFFMWGAKNLVLSGIKLKIQKLKPTQNQRKKVLRLLMLIKKLKFRPKVKKDIGQTDNFTLRKFTKVLVLKDGKPVWWTHDYEPVTRVQTVTGKRVVRGGSTQVELQT